MMEKCDSCKKYHFVVEGEDKGFSFEIHIRLPKLPNERTNIDYGSYGNKKRHDISITIRPVKR